jgi:polyisoprenoid-binding protein YceI
MSKAPDVATLVAAPGKWDLDGDRSSVAFRSTSLWGLVPVKGRFTSLAGAGSIGPDGVASGELVIDASSVTTGNIERDTHLRSDDFFRTTRHPQIIYRASAITPLGGDRVRVSGVLTVAGTSRPLEVDATVNEVDSAVATVSAHLSIDRSAWDVTFRKRGMTRMSTAVDVVARFKRSSVDPAPTEGEPGRVDSA